MRVWLIHMGETLQSDGPDARLWRLGLLAEELSQRGHDVVRWAPTFVHQWKRQRIGSDATYAVSDHHEIRLIYAKGYQRNISLARFRFHRVVAKRWIELAETADTPDIILASVPTPELCASGAVLARRYGVPLVIDVRDLWPDIYQQRMPPWGRPLIAPIIWSLRRRIGRSLAAASGIVAISETYLQWALNLAGRPRRPLDHVVPMSFQPRDVDPADVAEFEAAWRDRLGGRRFACVFLGSFTESFSFGAVTKAARAVESQRPGEVAWIMCGAGPLLEEVRKSAGDLTGMYFPGWVEGAEAAALLRIAAVGLAPYASDALMSMPNKPFEYAHSGLPVVLSLGGETRQMLESRRMGKYYDSDDATALATIVQTYLDDETARLGDGRRARALWEDFSPAVAYGQFADALELAVRSGEDLNQE